MGSHGDTPPQDPAAERAVLASVLLDNDVLDTLEGKLAPQDFFLPQHARIYEAALALRAERIPIDVVNLAARLREMEVLNTIGGPQYLGYLTDEIPTTAHCASHAALIRGAAVDREVLECAAILRHTRDRKQQRATVERLSDLLDAGASGSTVKTLGESLYGYFEAIEQSAVNPRQLVWPFPTLRRWAKGPRGGNVITIAGRPGRGKSVIGEQLAIEFAKQVRQSGDPGWGVGLFFALEMNHFEFCARALAAEAQVNHDYTSLVQPMTADVIERVTAAANALMNLPLVVDDLSAQSLASISALARRKKRERGLAFIVVDYLQLMESSGATEEKRQEFIGKVTRGLKVLAGKLDVPIIILAQMNREIEKRSGGLPQLADLRESGSIEQDSVAVLFLADGEKKEGVERKLGDYEELRLVIAKYRGARTGAIDIVFQKPIQRIVEKSNEADGAVETGYGFDDDAPLEVGFGEEVIEAQVVAPPRSARRITGGGGFTETPDEE